MSIQLSPTVNQGWSAFCQRLTEAEAATPVDQPLPLLPSVRLNAPLTEEERCALLSLPLPGRYGVEHRLDYDPANQELSIALVPEPDSPAGSLPIVRRINPPRTF